MVIPHLLPVFGIVLGVNLLPAFGPPTWALLVFFKINWSMNSITLVVLGVTAATIGRVLLALGARAVSSQFPQRFVERLSTAKAALESHKKGSLAIFVLFVVSPLPSAQLFVAAGLLELPLVPLTLGFVIGRLMSYSFYVALATLAEKSLGSIVGTFFGSPWAIVIQLLFLAAVTALPLVNWARFIKPSQS
jgi:uncharacterized membrane protein YdjX (TVP38/TMEM64 family)